MIRLRRLFVLGSALAIPLVAWPSSVRAQCTGYSANVTYTPLTPSDVAARGGVTTTVSATANLAAGGTSAPSHILTVTQGTGINFTTSSNHAVGQATWHATEDNGIDQGTWSMPLSGTWIQYVVMGAAQVGHWWNWQVTVTDANGNSTTDIVKVFTQADNPGNPAGTVVYQDELPTNGYAQVTINFGGGSMLNNCQQCQGGSTQHCLQATHTPYVTMSAVNRTSGESQSFARQQAGNVATATESVSGSGSIWISALPGDDVGGTANAEILCSMLGDLPVSGNDDWGIDWELAWTKFSTIQSSCLPAGGNPPSIGCKVTSKFMCNTNSQPADLQVLQVFAEFDTNGNPVTLETVPPFWWGWGFGIRGHISQFTTPWIFPANVLQQYVKSEWLAVSAGAFPSNSTIRNCTNKDKGTKPEIFPPLDQPL